MNNIVNNRLKGGLYNLNTIFPDKQPSYEKPFELKGNLDGYNLPVQGARPVAIEEQAEGKLPQDIVNFINGKSAVKNFYKIAKIRDKQESNQQLFNRYLKANIDKLEREKAEKLFLAGMSPEQIQQLLQVDLTQNAMDMASGVANPRGDVGQARREATESVTSDLMGAGGRGRPPTGLDLGRFAETEPSSGLDLGRFEDGFVDDDNVEDFMGFGDETFIDLEAEQEGAIIPMDSRRQEAQRRELEMNQRLFEIMRNLVRGSPTSDSVPTILPDGASRRGNIIAFPIQSRTGGNQWAVMDISQGKIYRVPVGSRGSLNFSGLTRSPSGNQTLKRLREAYNLPERRAPQSLLTDYVEEEDE